MNKQLLFLLALGTAVHAAPRGSASYSVATDIADAGGAPSASTNYTNDGSLGGITGISTVSSPAQTNKSGYIGQLTEVTALQLAADSLSVDETATVELEAWQVLDDDSLLALATSDVSWSVQSGPLTGIDPLGIATAGVVYEDTAATAQGDYAGLTGTLDLTVLNTLPDNFGTYAGDGLDDDWQFLYFGLNNPDAAPGVDPDGDTQDNAFEFTAGLIPTDRLSRFVVRLDPVPGQPTHRALVFSPLVAGRTYTVGSKVTLTEPTWDPLTGATESDDGDERTVTDTDAGGPRKFYTVEIEKP